MCEINGLNLRVRGAVRPWCINDFTAHIPGICNVVTISSLYDPYREYLMYDVDYDRSLELEVCQSLRDTEDKDISFQNILPQEFTE